MGTYLNPNNQSFRKFVQTGKYIDKTMLIDLTNRRLDDPSADFVCVSRPRRFGKSVAEDMLAAYYSKGADSRELFSQFKIAGTNLFEKNLNKFNVIKIDLNAMLSEWKVLEPHGGRPDTVIGYVAKCVCDEFRKQFADVVFDEGNSISAFIQKVYEEKGETFIIIIDEYDVMVREQVSEEEFGIYMAFLNSLFKNGALRPAISLAYLTGVLPIVRDKIQSKLNTFDEITMLHPARFAEFTGFTADEARALCEDYGCDFEECRSWYDGYRAGEYEIYNPQSVMKAVTGGEFASYWSRTSTYDVISERISMNFAGIKDDVVTMLGGGRVDVNVEKYRNTLTDFAGKDDIFTFLIHLGYLAYDGHERQCYIPNREVHLEWQNAVEDNEDYAETNRIIKESKILLRETIDGNEAAVAEALDRSHIHVTSNRSYNNEDSLQGAIYLAYIYALNEYTVVREMTAGRGFADIVYIPLDRSKSAIVVELKRNGTAETALTQIKERRYFDSLSTYKGDIILVGVNYDEKTKRHECKIERLTKEE